MVLHAARAAVIREIDESFITVQPLNMFGGVGGIDDRLGLGILQRSETSSKCKL